MKPKLQQTYLTSALSYSATPIHPAIESVDKTFLMDRAVLNECLYVLSDIFEIYKKPNPMLVVGYPKGFVADLPIAIHGTWDDAHLPESVQCSKEFHFIIWKIDVDVQTGEIGWTRIHRNKLFTLEDGFEDVVIRTIIGSSRIKSEISKEFRKTLNTLIKMRSRIIDTKE